MQVYPPYSMPTVKPLGDHLHPVAHRSSSRRRVSFRHPPPHALRQAFARGSSPRPANPAHLPSLTLTSSTHRGSHPVTDTTALAAWDAPHWALQTVRRIFSMASCAPGRSFRLFRNTADRTALTNARILDVLEMPWTQRESIDVDVVDRWLEREALEPWSSLSPLDRWIAAQSVESAAVANGEIVQPQQVAADSASAAPEIIVCVVQGRIRVAWATNIHGDDYTDLGLADTLVTNEPMAIVGLEQSTFIWLPRSTGQEVTEAYRIAQLEAWRPVIDVLLWQRSTWTPELVLALVDHAEGPYVTPALGYVYRQGDPTASRMVIIAAGSAVEFETDDESKLHLAVYEAGQFAGLEVCSTGKHRRTWLQAAKADVQWYALDAGVIRSEHPAIWDILVDVDEGRRLGTVRRERQHRRCRRAMALLEGNQRVRDGAADRERQEQRTQRLMKMLPKLASQGDDRRRSTLAAINIDIFRSHRDSTRRVPNFLHKLSSTPRRADEFRHGIDAALNGSADNDNDMDESDGLASAASAPAAAQARRRAPSLPKRERRRTAAERLSIVVPSGVAQLSAQGSRLNVKIFGKDVA